MKPRAQLAKELAALKATSREFAIALKARLRRCRICGKEFFAHRADRAYCSVACRRKRYEATDSFKAKRRDYMRERYRKLKNGNVRQYGRKAAQ